jgi:hypothetical protein
MEGIFNEGRRVGLAPQTLSITLIFSEERLRFAFAMEPVLAQLMMDSLHGAKAGIA